MINSQRNTQAEPKFDPSNSTLIEALQVSKTNHEKLSFFTRVFLKLAWRSVDHLHKTINTCIATGLQADPQTLHLFRIAQGIRVDLVESLNHIEAGHYSSVAPILRSALENACAMIALTQEEKFFIQLTEDDLNIPKCVGRAAKVFPHAGKRYGILTRFGVHQEKFSLGINLRPKRTSSHVLVVIPEHNHFNCIFTPILTESIIFISHMTCFTLELVFAKKIEKFETIERHGDTHWKDMKNAPTLLLSAKHQRLLFLYKIKMKFSILKMFIFNQ